MEIPNYPNYLIHPDGKLWSKSRMRFLKPHAVKDGMGYMLRHNKEGKNHRIIDLLATYYPENPPLCPLHLKYALIPQIEASQKDSLQ